MSQDDLYSTHADTIDAVITAVCRRHRLAPDRADELGSQIRLKLVENDFAVLRQFQGRSSIRTYLITVSERVLLDWRASEWGKWRPCQEARRLGSVAIDLDRLMTRDGMSFEEAVETLVTQRHAQSREELEEIRPKLATRAGRWMVGGEVLEHMPARSGSADERVVTAEREKEASKTGAALANALQTLPPQDQLILRLRFQDGFTVARIAELLGEEQKPLYRRFDRLFARLRDALAELGVTDKDVADLFAHPAVELAPAFSGAPGNNATGPSTRLTPGGRHA